jgi:lipopolysaccharide/colanic/teichoic acid biosynthesis glycosyltransferase
MLKKFVDACGASFNLIPKFRSMTPKVKLKVGAAIQREDPRIIRLGVSCASNLD